MGKLELKLPIMQSWGSFVSN